MNHVVTAFLISTVLVPPSVAATLRPLTTLDGPVVRLSDLFDDAGPDARRVLGPAPAPGARIVVEAGQLRAIARQFGVDWRPASSTDRAVLDRPGRLLPREAVMTALRTALTGVGAPANADIDVPDFTAPLVPAGAQAQATMEQLDYDGGSGRFTGVLAVSGEGMELQRLRMAGTVQEMLPVPVPVRRLAAGSVIQPGDLVMARLRAGLARGEVVQDAAQAVGMAVRHQTMAGQPVPLADLTRPSAVLKGARVTMQLEAPGITLSALGQAMEAGATGDRIRVMNPVSRAVVLAEITGQDQVRVMPGSIPLRQASVGPARFAGGFAGVNGQ
jgi:flagellar basal body P-ring formation protein FlgA